MTRAHGLADWFLRDPTTGQLTLTQPPNAAIATWLLARIAALVWDEHDAELRWIGAGAIIVWGADELVRGSSPFRRMLGGGLLTYQLWRLSS